MGRTTYSVALLKNVCHEKPVFSGQQTWSYRSPYLTQTQITARPLCASVASYSFYSIKNYFQFLLENCGSQRGNDWCKGHVDM